METSLLLHLCPEWVKLDQAGNGERIPFAIPSLSQPGMWTPRPWSASHPDTGSGDPNFATAEKGKAFFETICTKVADLLVDLSMKDRII
jgi:creatinine amidohydrolase